MALDHAIGWLFEGQRRASDRLIPRWLFLRALGLIYFSAFFSLTASFALTQSTGTAAIAGIVTDQAGAVLPVVSHSEES